MPGAADVRFPSATRDNVGAPESLPLADSLLPTLIVAPEPATVWMEIFVADTSPVVERAPVDDNEREFVTVEVAIANVVRARF